MMVLAGNGGDVVEMVVGGEGDVKVPVEMVGGGNARTGYWRIYSDGDVVFAVT